MPPAGSRSATQAREHLMTVLGPVVTATGHDLEDVTVTSAGRRSLVRVIVDSDGGVDLDAVADVSRAISEALDEGGDAFAGPYVLEVSSPGVDRPLTEPRHWRRAIGRLVQVTVGAGTVGAASIVGRVVSTDDAGVVLDVAGSEQRVTWGDLGSGRVQVEFNRPGPDAADDADDDVDDVDEDDADDGSDPDEEEE